MAVQIDKEELLRQLESVTPGLSSREIIEQSKCFIFQNKVVATFNDEVSCFQDCSLDIKGAVQSDKLLTLLRRLPVTTISVDVIDSKLVIRAKGHRKAEIPLESDIALPVNSIKKPKTWLNLPDDFLEAIDLVGDCVGKDESQFHLTCIHLHPDFIEAFDNLQAARYTIKTGLERDILVRKDSLKFAVSLGMTHFGVTKEWIHFKNSNGLILSCRLYIEEFPNLLPLLDVKGIKTSLPKGLENAVDCASIFSSTDADEDHVLIDLRPGKVRVEGKSVSGRYSEEKKIEYTKDPMTFIVNPKLLLQIISKYNSCILSRKENKLRVGMGTKLTYIIALGQNEPSVEEKSE